MNMSTITSCNNEIFRILGFSKDDLLEHSVNWIMPRIYADLHDGFMER